MAGPLPLQGDRAAWCRERLDFFCAVINNLDRESVKAELEACETEEDAEGLMHSLLWYEDNLKAQLSGGATAHDPSAPEVGDVAEGFPEEMPLMTAEEPPARQLQHHNEARQGLPAAAPEPYDIFYEPQYPRDQEPQYPRDHEPQYPREHEPQYPRDHDHPCHNEYQPLYDQQQLLQQEENDIEDHEEFPREAEEGCQVLHDAPRFDDHNFHPQQEQQEQQQHQEQQQQRQEQEQQQEEVREEADLIYEELQPELPPRADTPEPALAHDLASGHDLQELPRPQELPEDHPVDDSSDSEDHDQYEEMLEGQTCEAEAEPLLPDQQAEDVPMAAGFGDDTEPIDPTSERSDPYFDADEPSADDFVDVEEDPLEDDLMVHAAAQGYDEEAAAGGLDLGGAAEGRPMEEEEEEENDTIDDEKLAKELSEAINAEEQARMESDERLARELTEEMEREERRMEEEDEELARRLAEEMEAEQTEEQTHPQRQDNEQLAAVIAAEPEGNPPPAPIEEAAQQDVEGDEEMARKMEVQMMEEREEDEKAGRLVALMSMFPDADPTYLTERMEGVESEEAFRQVVEALLQCQKTEPRMSGYQKLLKQSHAAHHAHDDQEPAQAAALVSTTSAAASFIAASGQVIECTICFEEEVPAKDVGSCNALYNYHEFCIECIRKHVAALIGQGHSSFRCMNGFCESEFSWRTLRRVMEPVVYRKVQERRQQEEVMAAGVENLESCPFCCFMIIMPDPENKVLECLNPECLKESCRLCKEPSHIPLRCEEVEKDTQKDARVMLENRMAEAMIRQCPKCGKRFVTEGGCNKMTCSCGTIMCYLCKKVITDGYNHFEQRGGVASSKCPLWSNASELHTGEVRQAAAEGREQLEPGMRLVHDPTKDVL